jgi:RNA polymerase-binding transcription factor DksA
MQSFPSELLNELRLHLEEEKRKLVVQMSDLSAQDPFSDPDRTNDNAASDSEASEESSHDRFAAMLDELKVKLSNIDAALTRISDGSYGFCTNCQQMIDTDRLAILPTATLCLSCERIKSGRVGSASGGKK